MNILKLNRKVLGSVRQNLGAQSDDDTSRDDQITPMGQQEVFKRYLEWNGIIGYDREIWDAVESIKMAIQG